jgi:hypothetical protein
VVEEGRDFLADAWDVVVEIAKVAVLVLGIVVMIIGGPLAWVVLAAALIVLADTLMKYADGRASLWDVGFALLDCIPGGKGITTTAKLAKGLRGGARRCAGAEPRWPPAAGTCSRWPAGGCPTRGPTGWRPSNGWSAWTRWTWPPARLC